MKTKSFLFLLLLFVGLIACKKDEEAAPATLDSVTNKVKLSLDSLNNAIVSACSTLATPGTDGTAIRSKLQELLSATSFVEEVAYINPAGLMQIIEPPLYQQYQGTDFSNDTRVMDVIQKRQPVFSSSFTAMEGYDAVIDIHPIVVGTTSLGAIEALFSPFDLLKRIIEPQVSPPYEIWVMEKGGRLIFDPDLTGIGPNVYTDPPYTSFDNFISACRLIEKSESGMTSYTFYLIGTSTPVAKKAWWRTVYLHNNEWKIVWTQEE